MVRCSESCQLGETRLTVVPQYLDCDELKKAGKLKESKNGEYGEPMQTAVCPSLDGLRS